MRTMLAFFKGGEYLLLVLLFVVVAFSSVLLLGLMTTRQPGSNICLPVVLNSIFSTCPKTVVVENTQSGKNTAMKWRHTSSYTSRSSCVMAVGATPVGMMAWWSVTLLLSNTFLLFNNFLPRKGSNIS